MLSSAFLDYIIGYSAKIAVFAYILVLVNVAAWPAPKYRTLGEAWKEGDIPLFAWMTIRNVCVGLAMFNSCYAAYRMLGSIHIP